MTTDTTPRLLALVRSLEAEHGPGGWPAVEMATLSGLADAVERHAARVASLEAELVAARRDADRYRWLCANNFDRQGEACIRSEPTRKYLTDGNGSSCAAWLRADAGADLVD